MKRTIFLLLLLAAGPARANPIPADWNGTPPPLAPLVLLLDYAADLFFLLLPLLLLRKAALLSRPRLLWVAGLAMLGGLVADGVGGLLTAWWIGASPGAMERLTEAAGNTGVYQTVSFWGRVTLPIPLIFAVNYLLGRRFLDLRRGEAALVGLSVGVFTTPVLYTALEQFNLIPMGDLFHLYSAHEGSPLRDVLSRSLFAGAAVFFGLADLAMLSRFRPGEAAARRAWRTACLLLAVAPVAYAVPLTVLGRREATNRTCLDNLKLLALAVMLYRDDYDAYPAGLEWLTKDYVRDRSILRCPAEKCPWCLCSYRYTRPPLDAFDRMPAGMFPAEFVMLRCAVHPGVYVPVAYADGHVGVTRRKAAKREAQ